jgi:hypothetical protein
MPQTDVRLFRDAKGLIPIQEWLEELQRRDSVAFAKCVQRILALSRLPRELSDAVFLSGRNVVVQSHGLVKEVVVPDREINLAIRHKSLVEKNPVQYTAEWNP